MCFYTGRYMSTHGTTINFSPLRVDELTLADYLSAKGERAAVTGKTHISGDREALQRLGIPLDNYIAKRRLEGGLEPYFRDDGLHPRVEQSRSATYNQDLRAAGYDADNPWLTYANSSIDERNRRLSGWFYESAKYPADIDEYYSETPYTTRKAMEFIEDAGEQPWCLHLSYIKPHWPYVAPRPYYDMYDTEHINPPNRSTEELVNAHPVYKAMTQDRISQAFSQGETRDAVIPAYMGLIKQIDDQVGMLMQFLADRDQLDDTVIIFTSDHGDQLGDHWLGDKDSFYEESIHIPLIVVDPRPSADATRGTVCDELVESIDLLPTILQMAGIEPDMNRLEGRSLIPLIDGSGVDQWRDYVICEMDYSYRYAREALDIPPTQCRAYMLRNHRWKFILYEGYRQQLFDLENDPQELNDLGKDPSHQVIRSQMENELFAWMRQRKHRITITDKHIDQMFSGDSQLKRGVYLGFWSEGELPKQFQNSK